MTTIVFDTDRINTLDSNSKGFLGVGIVKSHLSSILPEHAAIFHPIFKEYPSDCLNCQVRHYRGYNFAVLENGELTDSINWESDLRYRIWTQASSETFLERNIMVEVKTGPYAEVERNQKKVMGLLNEQEENRVLMARVNFEEDAGITIQYQTLIENDSARSGFGFKQFELDTEKTA